MRRMMLVSAAAALLTTAGAAPAFAADSEHEVGLHQQDQTPITADDPEFDQGEECTGIPEGSDGWHFVLPGQTEFVELRVTFEPGGEQVITDFGPPSDKHAYVASEAGAELVGGSATVLGEDVDFRLSHTCPAASDEGSTGQTTTSGGSTTGETTGDATTGETTTGETTGDATTGETTTGETTGDATTGGSTTGETTGGDEPTDEGMAGGNEEETGGEGDLAETGSSAPVFALSAGAAVLLAAGGYLALRRRNAAAAQRD